MKRFSELMRSLPDWFSQPSLDPEEAALADLPPGIFKHIEKYIKTLPAPRPYCDSIRTEVRRAIQTWQANPAINSNSLVVLSRPVEAIAPILKASLQDYYLDYDVRFFLAAYQRSPDPLSITGHLQRELEPEKAKPEEKPMVPVTQTDIHDDIPIVNVIPSLEPCFLRCIQGWEGIEYFQSLVTQDSSRFWIFGCNLWAWAFLDKVCQVSAYLEQTLVLPDLSGDDLQTWLHPTQSFVVAKHDQTELEVAIHIDDESYWNSLASAAEGSSRIAAQLWLRSLRVDAAHLTEAGTVREDQEQIELQVARPTLPSLMSLDAMDRYLLHSLLIHGDMTRSHLALSLGEAERAIRSRVQVLRRENIIVQKGSRFSVHPNHYPKLYSELANNNFLIGEA
jgi:hypothetical protein